MTDNDLDPVSPPRRWRFDRSAVKARRLETEVTQAELGFAIGRTKQAISGWESGRSVPDADDAVALADALGLTLDDLFTAVEPEVAP